MDKYEPPLSKTKKILHNELIKLIKSIPNGGAK
jgi:hypothetical protein